MNLVYYPDPILGKGMQDFDFDKVDAVDMKQCLVDIMIKHKGVGLSAPQVGLNMRCFVMGESRDTAIMVINPEIKEYGTVVSIEHEGCLSFPGITLNIVRPSRIRAQWKDEYGKQFDEELFGYQARCFIHEMDHLNGISMEEHVSPKVWKEAVANAEAKKT